MARTEMIQSMPVLEIINSMAVQEMIHFALTRQMVKGMIPFMTMSLGQTL